MDSFVPKNRDPAQNHLPRRRPLPIPLLPCQNLVAKINLTLVIIKKKIHQI